MTTSLTTRSKQIMSRKLVHGVGFNDSEKRVLKIVDGKTIICPYYAKWQNMLKRCYKREHNKDKSYEDATVCEEWLLFSNFKKWMISQNWKGKHLDKDLLKQGNKVYSPENCIFVSCKINNLIKRKKGKYSKGVSYNKKTKKFESYCSDGGKLVRIGCFDSESDAYESYKLFKTKVIKDIANKQQEPLKSALLRYKFD